MLAPSTRNVVSAVVVNSGQPIYSGVAIENIPVIDVLLCVKNVSSAPAVNRVRPSVSATLIQLVAFLVAEAGVIATPTPHHANRRSGEKRHQQSREPCH